MISLMNGDERDEADLLTDLVPAARQAGAAFGVWGSLNVIGAVVVRPGSRLLAAADVVAVMDGVRQGRRRR